MDYRITRNEQREKPGSPGVTQIFICLEMDDGTEFYPFGYWLTEDEVAAVLADPGAIDGIAATASIRGERVFAQMKALRDAPPEPPVE